jgi:Flp pilus assembly protein TadG
MSKTLFRTLARDKKGSTLVEFAFVAPALLVFTLGGFDMGYRAYIEHVLQASVHKAGRDAALEGGATSGAAIDGKVSTLIDPLVDNASYTFTRKNFSSFSRAGQAEEFTDLNNNGACDNGEPYVDENNNSTRDAAGGGGVDGQGGAKDITVYTATVTYPRVLPMYGLLGWQKNASASATTVLRNQPYGAQASRVTPTRNCA